MAVLLASTRLSDAEVDFGASIGLARQDMVVPNWQGRAIRIPALVVVDSKGVVRSAFSGRPTSTAAEDATLASILAVGGH